MMRSPPRSPLFPNPTLSRRGPQLARRRGHDGADVEVHEFGARLGDGGGLVPIPYLSVVTAAQVDDRPDAAGADRPSQDRKSTRLNSSHANISYAVFCLKKQK